MQFLKSSISLQSDYLYFIFPFASECSECREELWEKNKRKQTISEMRCSKGKRFQEKFNKTYWGKIGKEPREWKLDKKRNKNIQRSSYEGSQEKIFQHTWNWSPWRRKVSKHIKKSIRTNIQNYTPVKHFFEIGYWKNPFEKIGLEKNLRLLAKLLFLKDYFFNPRIFRQKKKIKL